MKKYVSLFLGTVVAIVLFGIFIHPTIYEHTHYEDNGKSYPVIINRITGDAKMLIPSADGWMTIKHNQEPKTP